MSDGAEPAFADWYDYDSSSHELTPAEGSWFLRSSQNRFFHLAFVSFYDEAENPGLLTLHVTPAMLEGEQRFDAADASSPVYLDLDTFSVVSAPSSPESSLDWDLPHLAHDPRPERRHHGLGPGRRRDLRGRHDLDRADRGPLRGLGRRRRARDRVPRRHGPRGLVQLRQRHPRREPVAEGPRRAGCRRGCLQAAGHLVDGRGSSGCAWPPWGRGEPAPASAARQPRRAGRHRHRRRGPGAHGQGSPVSRRLGRERGRDRACPGPRRQGLRL